MDFLKTYPDTNGSYCDCDHNKVEKSVCSLCGAFEMEQPPFSQAELDKIIKELNCKSMINNPIYIPENEWKIGAMYLAITTEYEGHDGGVLIYGELTGDYDGDPLVLTSELDSDDSLGYFCTLLAEIPILNVKK